MKAWRVYSLGDMRLDDVPYPEPPAGWVTLKTRVVQASVTEAIRAKGGPTMGSDAIRRIVEQRAPVQLFGHEFCAEVVELGEGVTSMKVGDRVSARSRIPCHRCELCTAGFADRCRKGPLIGTQIPGALSEYLTIPAEALVVLPPTVNDSEGACVQPLSSCVADVADADVQTGDTVVIMGQGVMGLNILQLVRAGGAGVVIGVDVRPTNLGLSRKLGSDYQVNGAEEDPVDAVRQLTHGLGVDIVFECAGGSPSEGLAGSKTLDQALEIVSDGGKVVQVAMFGGPIHFAPDVLRNKSIKYVFPRGPSRKQLEYSVHVLARGVVKVGPTITHTLRGLEKVPEAFEITANKAKFDAVNPAQVVLAG